MALWLRFSGSIIGWERDRAGEISWTAHNGTCWFRRRNRRYPIGAILDVNAKFGDPTRCTSRDYYRNWFLGEWLNFH